VTQNSKLKALKIFKQLKNMQFGVIVFPGSNCDDDMIHAIGEVIHQPVVKIWHKDTALPMGIECVIVPGGFSYGDYVRAGAIARFSPIMKAVVAFAERGGLVWGVCNGFQILCEAGLLPGVLLRNSGQKFICKNVFLKPMTQKSPITSGLDLKKALKIPIAHAEGRFYADQATLDKMERNHQILFKYCDENGKITAESNPNGAERNIAGICNETRNVFGMMPHPERASETVLANSDGLGLFLSLLGAGSRG
jgi:phosphoribosylformylglycinamidine synthase subunit PurQ / glutaminase